MGKFKEVGGDWKQFRQLDPPPVEVDFHYSELGQREVPYWEAMEEVRRATLEALKTAHENGTRWVLFRHGYSTSEGWKQPTSRSQVRGLMRSTISTPYVIKKNCVQHTSVFLAAIRPKSDRHG